MLRIMSCHKSITGSGSIGSCILNLSISCQLHNLAALARGNKTQQAFNVMLEWSQSWCGRFVEKKLLLFLPAFELRLPSSPARNLSLILTSDSPSVSVCRISP
jgi:hypothetical protein